MARSRSQNGHLPAQALVADEAERVEPQVGQLLLAVHGLLAEQEEAPERPLVAGEVIGRVQPVGGRTASPAPPAPAPPGRRARNTRHAPRFKTPRSQWRRTASRIRPVTYAIAASPQGPLENRGRQRRAYSRPADLQDRDALAVLPHELGVRW